MVETVFVGGTPGASSEWNGSSPTKDLAFKIYPGKAGGWHSADYIPHYIWYDFKRPLRPAKISYLPYKPEGYGPPLGMANALRIKNFQFIGTDDPVCEYNSNWTVLCEGDSRRYTSVYDENGCTVATTTSYRGKFHCLGLRSLKRSAYNREVGLRGIRIWQIITES